MREILFKAKTKMIVGTYNCGKDDGEWVIGCLYCDVGKWVIRQFEFDRADYVSYEVDPETVCQYTGLTDKNGRKIFEGDICKTKFFGKDNGKSQNFNDYDIFKIVYKDGTYLLENRSRQFSASYIPDMCGSGAIEVVGNIFDNPELSGRLPEPYRPAELERNEDEAASRGLSR